MLFKKSKILKFNITDSTNIQLKRLAQEGAPHGFTVVANEQTNGRGRYDRTFVSPKNKGIYLSYLMRTNAQIADITQITAYTAVAVKRAIKKVCNLSVDIKWVNDLFANGRKICGILCESATINAKPEYIIIGIGVNVDTEKDDFGLELSNIATSIKEQTNKSINSKKLTREIIKQLNLMTKDYKKHAQSYFEEYKSSCINVGKQTEISINGEVLRGICCGVDEKLGLKLKLDSAETITVSSGEASIIKK